MTNPTSTAAADRLAAQGITFPVRGDTTALDAWRPYVRFAVLDRHVGVMARTRIEGAWSAYITGIPGDSHRDELREATFDYATKLPATIARIIFHELDEVPYAD